MKILIGIDDSAQSQSAIDFVRTQPWPPGSEALVLSAVEAGSYALVETTGARGYEELYQRAEHAQAALVGGAERALRPAGLAVTGRVVRSDAREALVRAAEEESFDLVVVGSHGRTGLPKLLLGSVAGHVVTHAPCSVLVVKRRADGKNGAP